MDFVVEYEGRLIAIEVKASGNVGASDLRGFASLAELLGRKKHEKYVFYLGKVPKTLNGVEILPWTRGLEVFE